MDIGVTITVRNGQPSLEPLYAHMASISGGHARARVLRDALTAGVLLCYPDEGGGPDAVRSRGLTAAVLSRTSAPAMDGDPGPIRVRLLLDGDPDLRPLAGRLRSMPRGRGRRDGSRLVLRVLEAGVAALYRNADPTLAPLPALAGHPAVPAAPAPAPAFDPAVREDMLGFMDNLSMDGL